MKKSLTYTSNTTNTTFQKFSLQFLIEDGKITEEELNALTDLQIHELFMKTYSLPLDSGFFNFHHINNEEAYCVENPGAVTFFTIRPDFIIFKHKNEPNKSIYLPNGTRIDLKTQKVLFTNLEWMD